MTKLPTKVPNKPPPYMDAFIQFVSESYMAKRDEAGADKSSKCGRAIKKYFTEHWDAFAEHVENHRPPKKQKVEQPYNENKLTRDTKTIVTKLQAIEENMSSLNYDDARENVDQIFVMVAKLHQDLSNGDEHDEKSTDPVEVGLPAMPIVSKLPMIAEQMEPENISAPVDSVPSLSTTNLVPVATPVVSGDSVAPMQL
jgi:hypothetical protein